MNRNYQKGFMNIKVTEYQIAVIIAPTIVFGGKL